MGRWLLGVVGLVVEDEEGGGEEGAERGDAAPAEEGAAEGGVGGAVGVCVCVFVCAAACVSGGEGACCLPGRGAASSPWGRRRIRSGRRGARLRVMGRRCHSSNRWRKERGGRGAVCWPVGCSVCGVGGDQDEGRGAGLDDSGGALGLFFPGEEERGGPAWWWWGRVQSTQRIALNGFSRSRRVGKPNNATGLQPTARCTIVKRITQPRTVHDMDWGHGRTRTCVQQYRNRENVLFAQAMALCPPAVPPLSPCQPESILEHQSASPNITANNQRKGWTSSSASGRARRRRRRRRRPPKGIRWW